MRIDNRNAGTAATCPRPALFPLGRIVATPAALTALKDAGASPFSLLERHQHGDFGDLGREDEKSNHDAVRSGARLLSAYTADTTRVWIITEAEDSWGTRASTCLLLPEEY
ncbi:hypothetical protein BH11PSE13_BH11PSE13_45230 [soil metagenome]